MDVDIDEPMLPIPIEDEAEEHMLPIEATPEAPEVIEIPAMPEAPQFIVVPPTPKSPQVIDAPTVPTGVQVIEIWDTPVPGPFIYPPAHLQFPLGSSRPSKRAREDDQGDQRPYKRVCYQHSLICMTAIADFFR